MAPFFCFKYQRIKKRPPGQRKKKPRGLWGVLIRKSEPCTIQEFIGSNESYRLIRVTLQALLISLQML